jgi:hypothetical protein
MSSTPTGRLSVMDRYLASLSASQVFQGETPFHLALAGPIVQMMDRDGLARQTGHLFRDHLAGQHAPGKRDLQGLPDSVPPAQRPGPFRLLIPG